MPSDAKMALKQLKEGNARFASGKLKPRSHTEEREELVAGQEPMTVILCCSDSRVAPEIIFDQGLGDMFVVRVAGNVIAPEQIGSIEYAIVNLGTRLIVVLGHSNCGAVMVALESLNKESTAFSPNLKPIIECIRAVIKQAFCQHDTPPSTNTLSIAVNANVLNSMNRLRCQSEIVQEYIHKEGVAVLGGVYSLETGIVTFYE